MEISQVKINLWIRLPCELGSVLMQPCRLLRLSLSFQLMQILALQAARQNPLKYILLLKILNTKVTDQTVLVTILERISLLLIVPHDVSFYVYHFLFCPMALYSLKHYQQPFTSVGGLWGHKGWAVSPSWQNPCYYLTTRVIFTAVGPLTKKEPTPLTYQWIWLIV